MPKNKTRIAIVGAGFAGVVAAIRLLENAKTPIEVILIERHIEQKNGGLAYGKNKTNWEHMLNLQAGRISIFREHRFDFIKWVNEEADRASWPQYWKEKEFSISSPVARRIYQQYLEFRLFQARREAFTNVTLVEVTGEVIDLQEDSDFVTIYFESNIIYKESLINNIRAEFVILATGHLENILPSFARKIEKNDFFIRDQYSSKGRKLIHNIGPNDTVLIIGSSLRAFDVVLSLNAVKHKGPIYLVSRNGLIHPTYPSNHVHEIIQLDRPSFLDKEINNEEEIIHNSFEWFQRILKFQKRKRTEQKSVLVERVLKASEPYISELISKLSPTIVQRLYDKYKTHLTINRVGVIPEIGNVIMNKMINSENGKSQLSIIKGVIEDINFDEVEEKMNTEIRILDNKDSHKITLKSKIVISCIGRETDYNKISNKLWRNLIDLEKAIPHKKTKRGIETSKSGAIICGTGEPSFRVHAVGIMREGDETQRNGRVGSFVFSIGPIRNQAFYTVVTVLNKVNQINNLTDSILEDNTTSINLGNSSQLLDLFPDLLKLISHIEKENLIIQINDLTKNLIRSYSARTRKVRILIDKDIDQNLRSINELLSSKGIEIQKLNKIMDTTLKYSIEKATQKLIDIKRVTYENHSNFSPNSKDG